MLVIGIHTIFTIIFTMLLIKTFDKLDKDIELKMTKRDMIGIAIVSLFSSFSVNIANINTTLTFIIISIITVLIIMMAYTDLKTMEVYGVINFIVLGLAIINFIYNMDNFIVLLSISGQLKLILTSLVILVVLFLTRGVGLGDTILYFSLMLIYLVSSNYGCLMLILNILISNTLFLITNSFKFIKNKKQKLPLIPYILVAWVVLMLVM